MKKIRWGIVGAGRIPHTFAKDISATDTGMVQAVAARRGSMAQAFAHQYGIATAHERYGALYDDANGEAVYVATPHTHHLQNASDALRAGKAGLCEKPITTNASECRQLIDVAEESSSYLMEALWTWFLPAIRKAKEWVDAGRIGDVVRFVETDPPRLVFHGREDFFLNAFGERVSQGELERAMVTDLGESVHAKAARFVPFFIAGVNGMAPLVAAAVIMTPLWLSEAGVGLPLSPIGSSIAAAFGVVFALGVLLGRVSGRFWLWTGLRTLLIALATALLILVIAH